MSKQFIISDTHFGHDNLYRFTRDDGLPARHPYSSAEACDEDMVDRWNSVVGKHDRVYHLGDVAMKRAHIKTLARLNGKIVLIRGNHDIFKLADYAPYVDDIRGTHKVSNVILSHYPVHPGHLPAWCAGNIHGHTHNNLVQRTLLGLKIGADPRYENVCVEQTDYRPVPLEIVVAKLNGRNR